MFKITTLLIYLALLVYLAPESTRYFEDVGASWVFGWFFAGAWWAVGSLVGTGQFVFDWFLASAWWAVCRDLV